MSCTSCGADWSGTRACHCVACHETFESPTSFDHHQSEDSLEKGLKPDPCAVPEDVGMVRSTRGLWKRETPK